MHAAPRLRRRSRADTLTSKDSVPAVPTAEHLVTSRWVLRMRVWQWSRPDAPRAAWQALMRQREDLYSLLQYRKAHTRRGRLPAAVWGRFLARRDAVPPPCQLAPRPRKVRRAGHSLRLQPHRARDLLAAVAAVVLTKLPFISNTGACPTAIAPTESPPRPTPARHTQRPVTKQRETA